MSSGEPSSVKRRESKSGREFISDPVRLHRILQNLSERRVLLSAKPAGDENWYNTALIGVNPGAGVLVLDELAPDAGHRRVAPGTRLRMMGVLGGVPVRFSVEVSDIGMHNGIALYRAAIPKQIEYLQNRADFRAYVPRSMELRVDMVMEDGTEITGRVLDVSLGGFGVQLAPDCPLAPLDVVTVRSLGLPGGQSIRCRAEICHAQLEHGMKFVAAGARFIDVDKPVERLLLKGVYCLEREQIRKRPRTD